MTSLHINAGTDEAWPLRAAATRRRRRQDGDGRPPAIEWLKTLAIVFGIVSGAFTVGYNWHEITQMRSDHAQHLIDERREHETFMPRELAIAQYTEIQRQLAAILLEQRARRR
jgi:hypothetical protein